MATWQVVCILLSAAFGFELAAGLRALPSSRLLGTTRLHSRSGGRGSGLSSKSSPADVVTPLIETGGGRTRRKMGPPQRKLGNQNQIDDGMLATGRVSVYCVGAEIDLVALRAHVFRRGFGAGNYQMADGEQAQLVLARGGKSGLETDEDEVLHVTNAPLVFSATSSSLLGGKALMREQQEGSQGLDPKEDMLGAAMAADLVKSDEASSDAEQLLREKVLMATQDVFYFDYGCVVFWGLGPGEERAALLELKEFTRTPVSPVELDDSFDTLEFVYDRKANPQRPIRFDRMRLRSLQVEEKLALSYAMAQSSKLFVFESKIFQSLDMTRYLPKELATKGRINSSKRELNKIIGQLFVEQTEVNLFSSILDTPDFLWDDDEHVPAYQYLRSYLEVDDRVALLNSRLSVIRELLDVLTAQVADNNSARLEWIVIWLISIEIIMGISSSPLFAGKRLVTCLLVPTAIIAFKRVNWNVPGGGFLGRLFDDA